MIRGREGETSARDSLDPREDIRLDLARGDGSVAQIKISGLDGIKLRLDEDVGQSKEKPLKTRGQSDANDFHQ